MRLFFINARKTILILTVDVTIEMVFYRTIEEAYRKLFGHDGSQEVKKKRSGK